LGPTHSRRSQSVDLGPSASSRSDVGSGRASGDLDRRASARSGKSTHTKALSDLGVPSPSMGTNGSLSDIVANLSQQNRGGWEKTPSGAKLEMVRAPPPIDAGALLESSPPPKASAGRASGAGAALARSDTQSSQKKKAVGDGELSRRGSKKSTKGSANGGVEREKAETKPDKTAGTPHPDVHSPIPGLQPRKSALRHASRTPSPALSPPPPAPTETTAVSTRQKPAASAEVVRETLTPSPLQGELTVPGGSAIALAGSKPVEDDTASISSYETGHEVFEAESDRSLTPPAVPPSSVKPTPNGTHLENRNGDSTQVAQNTQSVPNGHHVQSGSELSTSSASTATAGDGRPARRKSVRMSLAPSFAPTPPAFDEESDGGEGPWGAEGRRLRGDKSADTPRKHPVSGHPVIGGKGKGKAVAEVPPPPPKVQNKEQDEDNESTEGETKGGWRSRNGAAVKDMWEDSDVEDEDYGMARKMLARARE
jgi:hypothetical protein